MAGRINRHGWIVLRSYPSALADFCVDVFEDPDGGFGFEHFRADPEDGGRWTPIGGFGTLRFESPAAARAAAADAVGWFEPVD